MVNEKGNLLFGVGSFALKKTKLPLPPRAAKKRETSMLKDNAKNCGFLLSVFYACVYHLFPFRTEK